MLERINTSSIWVTCMITVLPHVRAIVRISSTGIDLDLPRTVSHNNTHHTIKTNNHNVVWFRIETISTKTSSDDEEKEVAPLATRSASAIIEFRITFFYSSLVYFCVFLWIKNIWIKIFAHRINARLLRVAWSRLESQSSSFGHQLMSTMYAKHRTDDWSWCPHFRSLCSILMTETRTG